MSPPDRADTLSLGPIGPTLYVGLARFGPTTPELVCKENWTQVLAYNLIRTVLVQAAANEGCPPRSISFKATLQKAKRDPA